MKWLWKGSLRGYISARALFINAKLVFVHVPATCQRSLWYPLRLASTLFDIPEICQRPLWYTGDISTLLLTYLKLSSAPFDVARMSQLFFWYTCSSCNIPEICQRPSPLIYRRLLSSSFDIPDTFASHPLIYLSILTALFEVYLRLLNASFDIPETSQRPLWYPWALPAPSLIYQTASALFDILETLIYPILTSDSFDVLETLIYPRLSEHIGDSFDVPEFH